MKTTKELSRDEISELKLNVFYEMLGEGSLDEVFGECIIQHSEEIPTDFIHERFEGVYFVEDDFFCNQ